MKATYSPSRVMSVITSVEVRAGQLLYIHGANRGEFRVSFGDQGLLVMALQGARPGSRLRVHPGPVFVPMDVSAFGDSVYLGPGGTLAASGAREVGHTVNGGYVFLGSDPRGNGGYAGFEDYNDTSTAAGLAIAPGVWTDVPNDGQGAFTNKSYSPGVGDLIDSSGRLVFSGLNLGDQVLIRNDIRVTPIISGAFLEWRYQLGSGAGTYYLTQPLGLLGDGAREYEFQFLQKIYIGDENTRQNLCIPQVRCTEDATFRNLGAVVTVFKLGA